jgi:hypothetical protein
MAYKKRNQTQDFDDDGYKIRVKKYEWGLLKGGPMMHRDNWYEFSAPQYKEFRNWCHRHIIEQMSAEERREQASRETIQQWYAEWIDRQKHKKNKQGRRRRR